MKQYAKWMWLLTFLGFVALAKGYAVTPFVQKLSIQQVTVLDGQWERVEEGGIVQYRYPIQTQTDTPICIYMKNYLRSFWIYLDEEPVYFSSDVYAMKGANQHLIRLPENAAGKMLVLQPEKRKGQVRDEEIGHAFLGEENDVIIQLFLGNVYALLFGGFTFLFGIGLIVSICYLRSHISKEMFWSVWHLCLFIFVAGIWVVTDSGILLFVTQRTAVVSLVSFVSFMIMPVPMLAFISRTTGEDRRESNILCRLFVVNAILYLLNYLFSVVPGYVLLLPCHLLCFYSLFMVLRRGIHERRNSDDRTMKNILTGFFLLMFFAVIAFVLYYLNPVSPYSTVYCIGIFLFILCLVCAAFQKMYKQMQENVNTELYKNLAYTDVMTGMKNRTAFMLEQEKSYLSPGLFYVVLDINYLKNINDQYGHQEGDAAIIMAASCIREIFEVYGDCYRIGGDEFVVIGKPGGRRTPDTDDMLQRLQKRIEKKNETREIPLSLAAGCAVRESKEDTADSLFKRADAQMYERKQKMKEKFVQNRL